MISRHHIGTALNAVMALAALSAAVLGIARPLPEAVLGIAIAVAIMLAGEFLAVTEQGVRSRHQFSLNSATHVFAILIMGPWLATLAAGISSLITSTLAGQRPVRILGNLVVTLAATLSAGVLFRLMGGGMLSLPADYPAVLAAVVVYTAVHLSMFGYLAAMFSAAPFRALRDEVDQARGFMGVTLVECATGALAAAVWIENPWLMPLLLPLGLSLFMAVQRGARLRAVTEKALETFATVVDERDRYTAEHSARVCEYSMQIGEHLGMSAQDLDRLYWTSRLHDLGKVAVDNAILNKPGRLTDEEFDVIKLHPVVSARILSGFTFDELETDIVLCHHERFDGRGYMRRTADTVPLEAYIIAVADSFDAMTSDRPYRKALEDEVALIEIHRNIGTQFHPVPARAFLELRGFVAPSEHAVPAAGPSHAPAAERAPQLPAGVQKAA